MSTPAEPMLRRFYLVALRKAADDVWGEPGVLDIKNRMPAIEREEALDDTPREWVPERVASAWCHAAWEGPAARDRDALNLFLRKHVDHGFGRLRRALLRLAPPRKLFEKVPELWQHDHSHGVLETSVDGQLGIVQLRHHPYVETPQARMVISEVFRYTVQLMRAKNVVETHALETSGALTIRIRWE